MMVTITMPFIQGLILHHVMAIIMLIFTSLWFSDLGRSLTLPPDQSIDLTFNNMLYAM